jgi:hypothetical protein
VLEPELSEDDHLRQVDLLARDVADAANDEGWLSYAPDPGDATPLQRAVNELARALRHWHFQGDGCLPEERPLLHLGGAALITPQMGEGYRAGCTRLGVAERAEGWALWHTWDEYARAHTMVVSAVETTQALLENWSRGLDVHPGQPRRSQVAAVARGWVGPITLSPSHATTIGLGGR